jgi:hypothetical protein
MKFMRIGIGLLVVLILYIGSYCVLSALGENRFGQSGRARYGSTGFAASDIVIWYPKFLSYQADFMGVSSEIRTRGNGLGYFYSPLILLDRKLVHKTELIPGFEKFHQQ